MNSESFDIVKVTVGVFGDCDAPEEAAPEATPDISIVCLCVIVPLGFQRKSFVVILAKGDWALS